MDVSLKPEQAEFIQTQIANGRYENPEDVIDRALSLLVEWEKSYDQWLQETRQKVDEGLKQIERGEVVDGEIVMNQLREKVKKAREEA
ncbi:type II toxin-antitoxin system ParD family antitoxin [Nodosilinea sp. PGN35]|uniref:ribbon-helix-helix domain-containing protein n=1 Tax=Nodosilinea sp. PGN35 TaxID=3020489 RepID=UPI0023B25E2A|nr:type II toxin-antitoxin system ParD family antitoxin [Nodosilinea sp. TSF1-S3]